LPKASKFFMTRIEELILAQPGLYVTVPGAGSSSIRGARDHPVDLLLDTRSRSSRNLVRYRKAAFTSWRSPDVSAAHSTTPAISRLPASPADVVLAELTIKRLCYLGVECGAGV
jgi:hypothetical protein